MKDARTLLGSDFKSTPELPQKNADNNAHNSPILNIKISQMLKLDMFSFSGV